MVGAGVSVTLDETGKRFMDARIALAAVAPVPLYLPEVGEWLAGRDTSESTIRTAAEMVRSLVSPISDLRGTADQRRHLAVVLVSRALAKSIQRAQDEGELNG